MQKRIGGVHSPHKGGVNENPLSSYDGDWSVICLPTVIIKLSKHCTIAVNCHFQLSAHIAFHLSSITVGEEARYTKRLIAKFE